MTEQCYNKGCGQKFDPENNPDDACCYHPGAPVFHDALKSWSCCTKRVTDFTAFLDIKGCARGKHNNVKPPEPPKPVIDNTVIPAPQLVKPVVEFRRPDETEPLELVPIGEVTASLRAAIEQEQKRLAEAATQQVTEQSASALPSDGTIKIGTRCLNRGCSAEYSGTVTPNQCDYHQGEPVFHEGMKYWSCCQRKTSDFTAFLEQRGCTRGDHRFVPTEADASAAQSAAQPACRVDWHQTGNTVTISVFAKNAVPDRCVVRANHCICEVSLVFDHGRSTYSNRFRLFGSVEPSTSSLRFLQPKVEVNLRKKDPLGWKRLDYVELPKTEEAEAEADGNGSANNGHQVADT